MRKARRVCPHCKGGLYTEAREGVMEIRCYSCRTQVRQSTLGSVTENPPPVATGSDDGGCP